jgi:hypothetical protein
MKQFILAVMLIISTIGLSQDLYSVPVTSDNASFGENKKMIVVSISQEVDSYGGILTTHIAYDKRGNELIIHSDKLRKNMYYVYINYAKYYFEMK